MKFGKKIGTLFLIGIVYFGATKTLAYTPNDQECGELSILKAELNSLTNEDHETLRDLYSQAKTLEHFFESNTKIGYYLAHLRDHLLTTLHTKKNLEKQLHQKKKKDFLEEHQESSLTNAEPIKDACIGRYETIDNMSFAYDFPTPLTIAIWYRESNCGYYLPKNGNGPFQIMSKNYGTGEITREIFETAIKDFFLFAKNKIQRYNSRNPETPMKLKYSDFNYQDILKFAALYNGLKGGTVYGDISPAAPGYFFDRTSGGEFENARRNGIFPHFLRVIEREVNKE